MPKKTLLLFIVFLYNLSASGLVVDDSKTCYSDFPLSYYYDQNKSLSIEEVEKIKFHNTTPSKFTFGQLSGNMWFKLTIINNSKNDKIVLYLTEPHMEIVDFYTRVGEKLIKNSLGFKVPLYKRAVQHANPIFIAPIKTNAKQTFYVKTHSNFQQFGEFQIYTNADKLPDHQKYTLMVYMFFFGALFIIILFNLFLYVKFRNVIFAYYVLYASSWFIFVFFFSGLNMYFNLAEYYYKLQVSAVSATVFLILFSIHFLDVKADSPYAYKVLQFLIFCFTIVGILNFIDIKWWVYIIPLVSVSIFVLFYASVKSYLKGNKAANYYTLAISSYILTIILLSLLTNGWIKNTNISRYSYLLGSLVEMITFTLMLVYKFYDIQLESLINKQELIVLQTNREQIIEDKIKRKTKSIENLLKDKSILLQEAYYGVQNNFKLMLDLLEIEASQNMSDYLQQLTQRIYSMSIVHKFLYTNNDSSIINVQDYFVPLIQEMERMYKNSAIQIKKDIDLFTLDLDSSIHLGMIASEIISNSIKYNDKEICEIFFSLKNSNKKVILTIKDNGPGFLLDEKIQSDGLGLKLITQFTAKLSNSSFSFSSNKGSHFEVSFSI